MLDADPDGTLGLLIVTHYWHPHVGGVETVARQHARELASRGWSCEVHSTRIPRRPNCRPDVREPFGVIRHAAWNPFERSIAVPVPVPAPGFTSSLSAAARRADVVVAHGHVYPTTLCALRAARRADRPFILVQHNPWVDYPAPIELAEQCADRTIGRRVMKAARAVVCVSRYTESYASSIEPNARTIVISNGVDTSTFRPTVTGGPPRRRFVCVRRLVPRTGVATLLGAWRHAALEGWELLIIGDGPSRRALEAASEGLAGVQFRRHVTSDELVDTIRTAWATVVPTTSGEGFGLVAAESHACGTPVIAARQGALTEVVCDGVDGLLVEPGSPTELGAAIRRVADDHGLRARLAQGCRRRDWGWSGPGAELDRLLRSVVSDARVVG